MLQLSALTTAISQLEVVAAVRQGIALRGHRDDQTSVESNPLQLPASLLRGQGYDGAGAMSGHTKGAAARIVAKYPKALYTHCASTNLIFVW